jgi:hypothetical protein
MYNFAYEIKKSDSWYVPNVVRDRLIFFSSLRCAPWISSDFFSFSEPAKSQRFNLAFCNLPLPSARVDSIISWNIVWDLLLLTLLEVERINLFLSPLCISIRQSWTFVTQNSVKPSGMLTISQIAYRRRSHQICFREYLVLLTHICPIL